MPSTKVRVSQGIVRGCEELLPNGKKFLRFSGIPYAKAPVNELRFQPPQRLIKFDDDEIDCTEERDACFHKSTLTRTFVGSEDCLNLNVYVPQTSDSEKLSVMFYIHGGGLKYDSNSKQLYSPEFLLMENVIVVTVNYRLHILGFLSLPSKGISGNNGLKDQQLALQWVYENISNFNGDPEKICVFGESAGASCVHFQVLNEKSRRYIKSAICQSGSAFSGWSFRGNSSDKDVRQVAKLLGCESESIDDVLETLIKAPVKDLYDNCEKNPSPAEIYHRFRRWRLVIEEESENALITKSSIDSVISQKGKIKIPIIFGTNDGDGMPRVAASVKKLGELNHEMAKLIPKHVRVNAKQLEDLAAEVKKFYFGDLDVSNKTMPQLVTMFTDLYYFNSQTISVDFMSLYQPDCKIFLNEFQFDGKLNIQKKLVKLEKLHGACHADDTFYLFGGVLVDKVNIENDSREAKMRTIMCKLWSNFAKFNDPTPDDSLDFKWNPIEKIDGNNLNEINYDYLVINNDMKMVRNLNKERTDFWRKIHDRWSNQDFLAKL